MKMHIVLWVIGLLAGGCLRGEAVAPAGVVSQALVEAREISFRYHGYERVVQPHAFGEAGEGRVALLAYQVSGDSESGTPPGWRVFLLAEMDGLLLTGRMFECRDDFRGEGRGLKRVTQRVKGAAAAD